LQPRLPFTRVQSRTIAQLRGKIYLPIFAPQNVGIQIEPPSDLRYKITPHSDILAKVPQGGVLRPRRLEHEKNNNERGAKVGKTLLVPRRKVWLTPTARVPCRNAANIAERKTSGKILLRGKRPRKCIHSLPAQETAKHHAKFG